MYHEGTIGYHGPKNNEIKLSHFLIRTAAPGSGIDGGQIIALRILIDGATVAHYENGWITLPDLSNDGCRQAYETILKQYN